MESIIETLFLKHFTVFKRYRQTNEDGDAYEHEEDEDELKA